VYKDSRTDKKSQIVVHPQDSWPPKTLPVTPQPATKEPITVQGMETVIVFCGLPQILTEH
jgi:hypothetical protein